MMKKIIAVLFALAMVSSEAYAFKALGHQTIAALAQRNLTEQAKGEVQAILKSDMSKNAMWLFSLRSRTDLAYVQEWQFTTLNAEGKSVTTDATDGIVALENAVKVLRNRKNESDSLVLASLRTVIQVVGDIHMPSNIRIEGNEATKGFKFTLVSRKTRKEMAWRNMWHNYANRHDVFSPEYYATDVEIFAGDKKAEYEKGTPRFWAENTGEDVVRCLKVVSPGVEVSMSDYNNFEYLYDKCMAKAGFRLAALLNDIFK